MIQTYYGLGKGKTCSAVGAAVRAAGSGMRVLFVQFLKNGDSCECAVLDSLEAVDILLPSEKYVLFEELTEERIAARSASYGELIFSHLPDIAPEYKMIVLDEVLDILEFGYADADEALKLFGRLGQCTELVLTGHNMPAGIADISDYISEIKEIKHPYYSGTAPRKGIEY